MTRRKSNPAKEFGNLAKEFKSRERIRISRKNLNRAFDAERCVREGFEALDGNFSAAVFARSVFAALESAQSVFDLHQFVVERFVERIQNLFALALDGLFFEAFIELAAGAPLDASQKMSELFPALDQFASNLFIFVHTKNSPRKFLSKKSIIAK